MNKYLSDNTPPASLVVDQLVKTVKDQSGELSILSEISFSVQQGASVAITGSSGAGKSTLLSLLAGLDTPTSGQVSLLGHDLFSLNEDERAMLRSQSVGFVFQSFQLIPQLTALENVMLPLELRGRFDSSDGKDILERVGLGHRLSHYPATLSGGEQQRVALARAFVQQPGILFADEPTGSLDSQTGQMVMDLMFELHHEYNNTLILVTHDRKLAERCDFIMEIHDGRLVEYSSSHVLRAQ